MVIRNGMMYGWTYSFAVVIFAHGVNGGSCHGVDLICIVVHAALRIHTWMMEWGFLYSTSISYGMYTRFRPGMGTHMAFVGFLLWLSYPRTTYHCACCQISKGHL